MKKSLSDIELVNLYKKTGNKEYVGELFTRYSSFVFAVSMRYLKKQDDSKDAVMQIFELLFSKLHTQSVENFKSWLYVVTKNYCLQLLRSVYNKKEIVVDSEFFVKNSMENTDEVHLTNKLAFEENVIELTKQLSGLRKEQRICIELFYLKNMCYKDISEKTGYTLNEVKSYIQNGKRNLQLIKK